MEEKNGENIKQLFQRFLAAEEAKEAAEDIHRGDEILRKNTAPGPDEKVIENIKLNVKGKLLDSRGGVVRRRLYGAACVAAAGIILTVLIIKIPRTGRDSQKGATASAITSAIWESDRLVEDDKDLSNLSLEVQQIEKEFLALRLGEQSEYQQTELGDLEVEMMEINGDFWKG
ncbi:MAG: hypothetical protein JXB29_13075 [Sedimentisphaerales bacterium]|nr:hypothetical protein [Sedimentisphaerales bacterium]